MSETFGDRSPRTRVVKMELRRELVIGGAVLAGGHVSVPGTFFGVLIIAIITQALVVFAIDPFVVQIVLGGLILWAVGVNRLREVRVSKLLGQKA